MYWVVICVMLIDVDDVNVLLMKVVFELLLKIVFDVLV